MTEIERVCGDCSLCCKLLEIDELKKPACVWCAHVKHQHNGCSIYPERPKSCVEFKCLWLLDLVNEDRSPLRTKVVVRIGNSVFGETVYLHEDVEGYARRWFSRHITGWLTKGFSIVIIFKQKRTLITNKPLPKKGASDEAGTATPDGKGANSEMAKEPK